MKNVFVLLHNGFEEIEALTIVDYLRRAEIKVNTVSMNEDLFVMGGHEIEVTADLKFSDLDKNKIDLLYIPGGMPAAVGLRDNDEVIELVKYLNENGKTIASMCAGPIVLDRAGVVSDKVITSYPSVKEALSSYGEYSENVVVESENIITSRGPATSVLLALKLIEHICSEEKRKEIEKDILLGLIRWCG